MSCGGTMITARWCGAVTSPQRRAPRWQLMPRQASQRWGGNCLTFVQHVPQACAKGKRKRDACVFLRGRVGEQALPGWGGCTLPLLAAPFLSAALSFASVPSVPLTLHVVPTASVFSSRPCTLHALPTVFHQAMPNTISHSPYIPLYVFCR